LEDGRWKRKIKEKPTKMEDGYYDLALTKTITITEEGVRCNVIELN
jgi:hypothetical protein